MLCFRSFLVFSEISLGIPIQNRDDRSFINTHVNGSSIILDILKKAVFTTCTRFIINFPQITYPTFQPIRQHSLNRTKNVVIKLSFDQEKRASRKLQ